MTVTFKLEWLDGRPAEPASFKTTILSWQPGDRIPLDAKRTLQVVGGGDTAPSVAVLEAR